MGCNEHKEHAHQHGPQCGHMAVEHEDHTDYLHEGHLHHMHEGHVDEHALTGGKTVCTPQHACGQHDTAHKHAPGCGHEAVPHEGHTDYLVSGHLHHPCGTHCDDHGAVASR